MPELNHSKHKGLAHEVDGSDLVLTVTPPTVVDLATEGTPAGSSLAYTLTVGDNGSLLSLLDDTYDSVTLTIPAFDAGYQVVIAVIMDAGGTLTLSPAGGYVSVYGPTEFTQGEDADGVSIPIALTLLVDEVGTDYALRVVGSDGHTETMTVVYDSGWPADRPFANTVLAIGHTGAPTWLTDADVWFEDVS